MRPPVPFSLSPRYVATSRASKDGSIALKPGPFRSFWLHREWRRASDLWQSVLTNATNCLTTVFEGLCKNPHIEELVDALAGQERDGAAQEGAIGARGQGGVGIVVEDVLGGGAISPEVLRAPEEVVGGFCISPRKGASRALTGSLASQNSQDAMRRAF